jgi:hypothetical protein
LNRGCFEVVLMKITPTSLEVKHFLLCDLISYLLIFTFLNMPRTKKAHSNASLETSVNINQFFNTIY